MNSETTEVVSSDFAFSAVQSFDVDRLAESLQRQGTHAFEVDWAALLDSIATITK